MSDFFESPLFEVSVDEKGKTSKIRMAFYEIIYAYTKMNFAVYDVISELKVGQYAFIDYEGVDSMRIKRLQ